MRVDKQNGNCRESANHLAINPSKTMFGYPGVLCGTTSRRRMPVIAMIIMAALAFVEQLRCMPKPLDVRQRNREHDAKRRAEYEWRSWYGTSRWRALRRRVFLRDLYTCRMCKCACGAPHADHVKRHNGDPDLFWDDENVQTLCPDCHNKDKQRIERGGFARSIPGADGWPT
jgi:5-methylcytosine-specific restriction protein A